MEQNSNESKKLNKVYRILFVLLFGMVGIGTWYYIKQREKIEKEINKQPAKKEEGGLY